MEQSEKKNAERYLVVAKDGTSVSIWAEDFGDVLKEISESAKSDSLGIRDDDIVLIMKLECGGM